jgi:hypothetical protein
VLKGETAAIYGGLRGVQVVRVARCDLRLARAVRLRHTRLARMRRGTCGWRRGGVEVGVKNHSSKATCKAVVRTNA